MGWAPSRTTAEVTGGRSDSRFAGLAIFTVQGELHGYTRGSLRGTLDRDGRPMAAGQLLGDEKSQSQTLVFSLLSLELLE